MRRCLVTGGAGFIGSHLVDALLAEGQAVRVLDDFSTGNLANLASAAELIRGSVTDPNAVKNAVKDCEVVYHLAAVASVTKSVETPGLSHAVCATGTLNVLDAARQLGVRRVVYAGSSSAYGDQPGDSAQRDRPADPAFSLCRRQARRRALLHRLHRVYGLETVRLRFFNVFGPRQDASSPYSGVIALFITLHGPGQNADDLRRRPASARFRLHRQCGASPTPCRRRQGRKR